MKKLLAILLTICLLASLLYIPAFASHDICVVSGLKADGTLEEIGQYNDFVSGWNKVASVAANREWLKTNGYERIVMDIYKDWVAPGGEFCDDGVGFSYDAIYVPENARVTLNLNGHTINRAMSDWEWNGEVMYIDENADVIINNGTITGGWSGNGAGGLHVMDKATVTLNDVHVDGNKADDDNGAGIALYNGATLTMNGGSISNNKLIGTSGGHVSLGIGIYSEGSTVVLDGVEIKNNRAFNDYAPGAAIFAYQSDVTIKNCIIRENGIKTDEEDCEAAFSVIHPKSSQLTATKNKFTGNGSYICGVNTSYLGSSVIRMDDSAAVTLEACDFENNNVWTLLHITGISNDSAFYANKCNFLDNNSLVYYGGTVSVFKECTFNNNKPQDLSCVFDNDSSSLITFTDCSMGDSTYEKEKYITFEYTSVSKEEAVLGVTVAFGDGSTSFSQYYKSFEEGWDAVEEHASSASGYERVTVDLYADWNSGGHGAVSIPENARMTLNLNGHKIDRATQGKNWNGEVLYVSANADVIINDGTITGGNSRTGASGIHINDNAKVVLNDVNVDDNHAAGGTNGAAIAVYNGATLVMNGGSLSDNFMDRDTIPLVVIPLYPYGALYVNDATATLNNVTISNNTAGDAEVEGAAIYIDNSTVTLNDCVVSGNINAESDCYAESVIGAEDSTLIINNTDFTDNGKVSGTDDIDYCSLFDLVDCKLTMVGGKITENHADKIFYLDDTGADITGVTVTGNASIILDVDNDSAKVTLTDCVLGNNEPVKDEFDVIVDVKGTLAMSNCDLGDTIFEDKRYVDFGNGVGAGSIFGGGSFTVIIAFVALLASAASFTANAAAGRKRGAKADN